MNTRFLGLTTSPTHPSVCPSQDKAAVCCFAGFRGVDVESVVFLLEPCRPDCGAGVFVYEAGFGVGAFGFGVGVGDRACRSLAGCHRGVCGVSVVVERRGDVLGGGV